MKIIQSFIMSISLPFSAEQIASGSIPNAVNMPNSTLAVLTEILILIYKLLFSYAPRVPQEIFPVAGPHLLW